MGISQHFLEFFCTELLFFCCPAITPCKTSSRPLSKHPSTIGLQQQLSLHDIALKVSSPGLDLYNVQPHTSTTLVKRNYAQEEELSSAFTLNVTKNPESSDLVTQKCMRMKDLGMLRRGGRFGELGEPVIQKRMEDRSGKAEIDIRRVGRFQRREIEGPGRLTCLTNAQVQNAH